MNLLNKEIVQYIQKLSVFRQLIIKRKFYGLNLLRIGSNICLIIYKRILLIINNAEFICYYTSKQLFFISYENGRRFRFIINFRFFQ